MCPAPTADPAPTLRRLLLAVLVLGLAGTGGELVLLEHYEDSWQLVPIFFIAGTLVVIAGHLASPGPGSIRLLQVVMLLLIVSGVAGVLLHYRGSMEFQLEMDATQSGWDLFSKVLYAKSPPTLAPGAMAQLGLIGLVYTYRHPALRRRASSTSTEV